jgi:chromosome segregation ATPase
MRKWTFVIIPVIALGIFTVFYMSAVRQMEAKEEAALEAKARMEEEERMRKEQIAADTRRQQEESRRQQEAEEAAALAKREADWAATSRQLVEAAQLAEAEIMEDNNQIAALRRELEQLRTQKEQALLEEQALAESVEQAKIQVRNSEIEYERLKDMLLQFVSNSSIANPPAPALPAR